MKIVRSSQAALVAIFCALAVVAAYLLPLVGTFDKQDTTGGVSVDEGVSATSIYRSTTPSVQKTVAEFEKTWKPLGAGDAENWGEAFLDAKPVPSGTGKIVPATLRAFANEDLVMVRSGLIGSGVVEPSGISLLFDKTTRQPIQRVETIFLQGAGGGTVTTWIDGTKVLDRFVPDQVPLGKNVTVGWNEFTACLNGAGVASWVITAITIACSAICVGSAGTGCVPCLVAAGGITGGVFYSCAARGLFYS